jgi:hypothetical protein
MAFVPPVILLEQEAKALPYIHDVTTDPFDPPAFTSLLADAKAVAERRRLWRHRDREAAAAGLSRHQVAGGEDRRA